MIIVSSVKNEMEVGIMIVHRQLYMVDMEMVNLFSRGNVDNLEVGNTIVKNNGSKQWLHSEMDYHALLRTKYFGFES